MTKVRMPAWWTLSRASSRASMEGARGSKSVLISSSAVVMLKPTSTSSPLARMSRSRVTSGDRVCTRTGH